MTAPARIWLLGYPVALGMSTVEHVEDWVREFRLMALSGQQGTATTSVPDRLRAMVETLTRHYTAELSEVDRLRSAAAAHGDATVDLSYPALPDAAAAVRGWATVLAEVDAFCSAEELLTLQRSDEQVRLQDWVCEEFLRQLGGEPPRRWPPALSAVPDA